MNYREKYLKYKKKYLNLKYIQIGRSNTYISNLFLWDEDTKTCKDASSYINIDEPINEYTVYQIKLNFKETINTYRSFHLSNIFIFFFFKIFF